MKVPQENGDVTARLVSARVGCVDPKHDRIEGREGLGENRGWLTSINQQVCFFTFRLAFGVEGHPRAAAGQCVPNVSAVALPVFLY